MRLVRDEMITSRPSFSFRDEIFIQGLRRIQSEADKRVSEVRAEERQRVIDRVRERERSATL